MPTIRAIEADWSPIDLINDRQSAIALDASYLLASIAEIATTYRTNQRWADCQISLLGSVYLLIRQNRVELGMTAAALACLAGRNVYLKSAGGVLTDIAGQITMIVVLQQLPDLPHMTPRNPRPSLPPPLSLCVKTTCGC